MRKAKVIDFSFEERYTKVIAPENLEEEQKMDICERLMKNLTLSQLENLEEIAKTKNKKYIIDM